RRGPTPGPAPPNWRRPPRAASAGSQKRPPAPSTTNRACDPRMLEAGAGRRQLTLSGFVLALAPFGVCLNLVGALNRVKWATLIVAGAGALAFVVPACILNQPLSACLSAKDCNLDRICEAGH